MKSHIAIDLKSFYASVERGLDPLTTNLVVADESRTAKTICLAATPVLKSYGIAKHDTVMTVFEPEAWHSLVDFVTVYGAEDIRFTFKNGKEI